jgi:hypothetical protein
MSSRIFGHKKEEVTGGWKILHNEEIHNLYTSPHIIRLITSRRIRFTGYLARMGYVRNMYKILIGISEGKKPLGRPRSI